MKALGIFILAFGMSLSSFAQKIQITRDEAARAAITWIQTKNGFSEIQITSINSDTGQNGIVMYEVETSVNKTVLLSGSRACLPILATYAGSQLYDDNLPCGLTFLFDYYRERIDSSFSLDPKEWHYAGEWADLIRGKSRPSTKGTIIAPLISSNWRQHGTNDTDGVDGYNYMITNGDGCNHCLAGCVAVAMGQVLNYWKSPILTYAQTQQYDWCNMPNDLYTNDIDYEKKRDAVAFLLSRCGEFVDMKYGCDGSSATIGDASTALKEKFGFHKHTVRLFEVFIDSDTWKHDVIYDLSVGRPVIYGGNKTLTSGGHAFICDGYNGDNLFHFNWGWGKYYNDPSFLYTLDNPSPNTNTNYKYLKEAIFNARPNNIIDFCEVDLLLSEYYGSHPFVLFPTAPSPPNIYLHELVPQTMTTLTSASASSPAAWRTIPAGASAEYVAHEEVILEDGFEAEWGSEFEAWIEPCVKCGESRGDGSATRTLTQREDSLASDSTEATYMAPGHSEFTIHNSEFKIGLFPNPTDGPLTMETDGEVEAVVVYDAKGLPVGGWRLVGRSGRSLQLDVAALRPGAYILSVRTAAGTSIARFVRR